MTSIGEPDKKAVEALFLDVMKWIAEKQVSAQENAPEPVVESNTDIPAVAAK